MSSINKVILIGRVGRDPEIRNTASGNTVAKFRLATSSKRKTGEEDTQWHTITVFGRVAENFVAHYVHKGDLLYIDGRLTYSQWEKDGQNHERAEIIAFDLQKLSAPAKRNGGDPPRQPAQKPQRQAQKPLNEQTFDDDVPF